MVRHMNCGWHSRQGTALQSMHAHGAVTEEQARGAGTENRHGEQAEFLSNKPCEMNKMQ